MYKIETSERGEEAVFWDGREAARRLGAFRVPLDEALSLAGRLRLPCERGLGEALRGIDGVIGDVCDVVVSRGDQACPVDYGRLDDAVVELAAYGTAARDAPVDVLGLVRVLLAITR